AAGGVEPGAGDGEVLHRGADGDVEAGVSGTRPPVELDELLDGSAVELTEAAPDEDGSAVGGRSQGFNGLVDRGSGIDVEVGHEVGCHRPGGGIEGEQATAAEDGLAGARFLYLREGAADDHPAFQRDDGGDLAVEDVGGVVGRVGGDDAI